MDERSPAVIQTMEGLAASTRRRVDALPLSVRAALSEDILIEPADGSDAAATLAGAWPGLPDSFLDVVRRWSVLGRSFTGFIDLARADRIDGRAAQAFGLDLSEFIPIGTNGSGDPIGVAPQGATQHPPGSVLHLNHDRGTLAVVAPDLESLLIGLGNYGVAWEEAGDAPEAEAEATTACRDRLLSLGWADEILRQWPGANENGLFA